jgi:hypothetical protein
MKVGFCGSFGGLEEWRAAYLDLPKYGSEED